MSGKGAREACSMLGSSFFIQSVSAMSSKHCSILPSCSGTLDKQAGEEVKMKQKGEDAGRIGTIPTKARLDPHTKKRNEKKMGAAMAFHSQKWDQRSLEIPLVVYVQPTLLDIHI